MVGVFEKGAEKEGARSRSALPLSECQRGKKGQENCYALGWMEQCSVTSGAMLLSCWSYALKGLEQCFGTAGAMCWGCRSRALGSQEQCAGSAGAMHLVSPPAPHPLGFAAFVARAEKELGRGEPIGCMCRCEKEPPPSSPNWGRPPSWGHDWYIAACGQGLNPAPTRWVSQLPSSSFPATL